MQAQPIDGITLPERDVKLIADLIMKAVNLPCGEAFAISDRIIVARSASGKLWIGSGGINCNHVLWWKKGDLHQNLADTCRSCLNWRTQGYFANDFRKACEEALRWPSLAVTGIGRKEVFTVLSRDEIWAQRREMAAA